MDKKTKRGRIRWIIAAAAFLTAGAGVMLWMGKNPNLLKSPEDLLVQYHRYLKAGEYDKMYAMLDEQSRANISQGDFEERNRNIYQGIGARDIETEVTEEDKGGGKAAVSYNLSMETDAGTIRYDHTAVFKKKNLSGYYLAWKDNMIFPGLDAGDKVKVSQIQAQRGRILDRKGYMLAGPGKASSVGLVPGKMKEEAGESVKALAGLLGIAEESIQKSLDAKWVKEDSLVPIKTIKKAAETDTAGQEPSPEDQENQSLQEQLLEIPGVMISDVDVRTYPLAEAASHLTGYVQKVTAEELEKHKGEGYGNNSVIGRSGIEGLYEKELKGKNGCEITIADEEGNKKEALAAVPKEDGRDIQLTIDASLQSALYQVYGEDKSCSAAMNPYTGEVLALVSTPSFDSNGFILGLTQVQWDGLNQDERKPLYNRFRQSWCPGSSFKPIMAAIGLATGDIEPQEDYQSEGLSWQKDAGWGDYRVTTLHQASPATLENALVHSDNIYFAKAALRIGAQKLMKSLEGLGFNGDLPFEISMAKAQYANKGEITGEIQLADSGYGQGQVLINPLHLAALYTSFLNTGNVIRPYLLYRENPQADIWIPQAFPADAAELVNQGLEQAVNSPEGTGYGARREDIRLAGKTGTAEIKASKEDKNGTELGWFGVYTADPNASDPVLLMTMVEDVKDRGGSGYVVKKAKEVLDRYLDPVQ